MDKIRLWWRAHRPTTRRLAQLYCALLYNANLRGFSEGRIYTGGTKNLCVPGLNCYSCPGAVAACPLGALQNALASSGTRAGTYVLGILLLFGISLGRTICGWLCPMGLLQELLHKIPSPKLRKSRVTRVLSLAKYVILAVFVLLIPLYYGLREGLPVPAFCKYICPAGTLEGAVALLSHPRNASLFAMLGEVFTRKAVILVLVLVVCVFCYRAFCRFLCPLGALYGLFNRVALLGIRVNVNQCTRCGRCVGCCPMDIRHPGDRECISCGKCVDVCAAKAISMKAGKITLRGPQLSSVSESTVSKNDEQKPKRIVRVGTALACFALAFALLWYNVISPAPALSDDPEEAGIIRVSEQAADLPASTPAPLPSFGFLSSPTDAETSLNARLGITGSGESGAVDAGTASAAPTEGHLPGQRLPDFTVDTLDGGTFRLSDARGHVTLINLWATYCEPCVRELPYFCRLRQEYPDLRILAVHASLVTEDVPAYIAAHGWDLDFAVDPGENRIRDLVGATELLPHTVVLNSAGEVIYNQAGSVTWEKLVSLLAEAMDSNLP